MHARPCCGLRNPKPRKSMVCGASWTRRRTREITPRVPSEPVKTWFQGSAGPAPARTPVWTTPPAGGHHLEAGDHVLDLPVPARILPRGAGCDPAPRSGARDGRGVVTQGEPEALETLLQEEPVDPGLHLDLHLLAIHLQEAAHALQVELHPPLQGDRTAADAGAPGDGDQGHPLVMTPGHRPLDVHPGLGPDHAGPPVSGKLPALLPDLGPGPEVGPVGGAGRPVAADLPRPEELAHVVEDLGRLHCHLPVPDPTGLGGPGSSRGSRRRDD